MKSCLVLAASSLALVATAHAESYNLRLAKDGDARTIAVSTYDDATFAVASGGDNLEVLTGDKAVAAFTKLKEAVKSEDVGAEIDDIEHSADGHRKIVVHKMDVDDDDLGDDHEVRIIKKSVARDPGDSDGEEGGGDKTTVIVTSGDGPDAEDDAGDGAEDVEEVIIIGAGDAPEESFKVSLSDDLAALEDGEKTKTVTVIKRDGEDSQLIEITGATADAAREFIDDAEGIDSLEAVAMRKALGL